MPCCEEYQEFPRERTVNTRVKGNPVKAVREGSIIFRFESPTNRKSAKCNRKTRRFLCRRINIGSSRVSIHHGRSVACVNMYWTLDERTGSWTLGLTLKWNSNPQ